MIILASMAIALIAVFYASTMGIMAHSIAFAFGSEGHPDSRRTALCGFSSS